LFVEIRKMAKVLNGKNNDLYVTYANKDKMIEYLLNLGGDISSLEGKDGETIAERILEREQEIGIKRVDGFETGRGDIHDKNTSKRKNKNDDPLLVPRGFTLDANFAASTWRAKCSKRVMRYHLENAGVDPTEYEDLKGTGLAEYIVDRKQKMEEDDKKA
jgi:hypothetical protein